MELAALKKASLMDSGERAQSSSPASSTSGGFIAVSRSFSSLPSIAVKFAILDRSSDLLLLLLLLLLL
ncbi:hypothetical protein Syun_011974 [Stephania yunnanensis]|uniref:Uncharacterized protein n=1 Tax=Stephania yunnanensis TaxID=152371 RepID=A0AAP0JZC1_9MAGN